VSNESSSSPPNQGWRREISIAAGALGLGLIALPFAIYFVGQRLLGEYRADAGAMALAEAIWLDLLSLSAPAWVLVLSPYVIVQLLRWVKRVWQPKPL
jgi:hypothetical protein